MVVDKFGKPVRNARVSVKGIRHDVTAGELLPGWPWWPRPLPALAVSPGPSGRWEREAGTGVWCPRLRLCGVGPGPGCPWSSTCPGRQEVTVLAGAGRSP